MFGFKKPSKMIAQSALSVQTIPNEFYAGASPVIKFKTVQHEVIVQDPGVSTLKAHDKKLLDKATAVGGNQPLHPVHIFSNSKVLFGGLGILFVLFIGGSTWYYVRQFKTAKLPPANSLPDAVVTAPTIISTPPDNLVLPEPASTEPTPSSTSPAFSLDSKLEFPSQFLADSTDTDRDDLTDVAEELFKTNPEVPDTDNDKYADGHESYNLYNPAGKEPEKIIDSGIIKDFENPVFGYRLFFPTSWTIGNVDGNYRDVLFSTYTGEYVEVRVFDKQPNETFPNWFTREAKEQNFGDLLEFKSVFKQSGLRRKDYLAYYFEDAKHFYVIVYHTTEINTANYRSVIKMMARSFKFAGQDASSTIPARIIEEGISEVDNKIRPTKNLIPPTVVSSSSATPAL